MICEFAHASCMAWHHKTNIQTPPKFVTHGWVLFYHLTTGCWRTTTLVYHWYRHLKLNMQMMNLGSNHPNHQYTMPRSTHHRKKPKGSYRQPARILDACPDSMSFWDALVLLLFAMIRSVVKSFKVPDVEVVAARMCNEAALTHMTDSTPKNLGHTWRWSWMDELTPIWQMNDLLDGSTTCRRELLEPWDALDTHLSIWHQQILCSYIKSWSGSTLNMLAVYGLQTWTQTDDIEIIQRRTTKLVSELRNVIYTEYLRQLKLTTWLYREGLACYKHIQ